MTDEDTTRRTTTTATPQTGPQVTPAAPTRLELSPAQIAGSALAAVSSAFFASWAGTAGTLIGVAVGSVIATVGAATYTWWLRRTQEAVRRRAALVRQTTLATNGLPRTVAVGPLRRRGDRPDGTDATRLDLDPVTAGVTAGAGAGEEAVDVADEDTGGARWALPWKRVLLTSVAVMAIALAVITGFESLTGRTVASYTGGGGSGSTVGSVLGQDSTPVRKPTQESTPTPTPTPSSSASSSPSQAATSTPTPTPTPSPAVPTPSSGTTSTPGSTPTPTPADTGATTAP